VPGPEPTSPGSCETAGFIRCCPGGILAAVFGIPCVPSPSPVAQPPACKTTECLFPGTHPIPTPRAALTMGDNPYPGLRVMSTPRSNYGNPSVVDIIKHLGEVYHDRYPAGPLVVIGDLSPEVGTGHEEHNGYAVDVLPMTMDGNIRLIRDAGAYVTQNVNYDPQRTIEVIQMFLDSHNVRYIIYDDQAVVNHFNGLTQPNGKPVLQTSRGNNHHNHFHVYFNGAPTYGPPRPQPQPHRPITQ
jgi:hypothetical protein